MPNPTISDDQVPGFRKPGLNNQKIAIIALAIITIGAMFVGVWGYMLQGPSAFDNTLNDTIESDDSTARVNNSIDSLIIEFTITGNPDELFGLVGITRYDGYISDAKVIDPQYSLELVSANGLTYTSYFNVPVVIAETVTPEGSLTRAATYSQKSIAVKTPSAPEGSKIIVRDKAGKVVFEDTVHGVVAQDSNTDYETITGNDAK